MPRAFKALFGKKEEPDLNASSETVTTGPHAERMSATDIVASQPGVQSNPTPSLLEDEPGVDRVADPATRKVMAAGLDAPRDDETVVQRGGRGLSRVWRDNWLFLLVVGGIVIAFLALRTPASRVGSVEEVDAILQGGQPTVVEFYSNT